MEAWEISSRNPRFVAVARIATFEVRQLRLDVRWDRLPTTLPGADGHAGIIGLDQGSKIERRVCRVRLADLANGNPVVHLGPPPPFLPTGA